MEYLCENYPLEAITFFKRAIQMTMITGTTLVACTGACIYVTWNSKDWADGRLKYWSTLRVLIFIVQVPIRYRIWSYISHAGRGRFAYEIAQRLHDLMQSFEWKFTQYLGAFLSLWVIFTFFLTLHFGTQFKEATTTATTGMNTSGFEGYLSPCLFRLCWISVIVWFLHIVVVLIWLNNIFESSDRALSYHLRFEENNDEYKEQISDTQLDTVTSLCDYGSLSVSTPSVSSDNNRCVICWDFYKDNEILRRINFCKHTFHSYCIDTWLKTKARCPLCGHLLTTSLGAHHISFDTLTNSTNEVNSERIDMNVRLRKRGTQNQMPLMLWEYLHL